jgi:hypothetical protein
MNLARRWLRRLCTLLYKGIGFSISWRVPSVCETLPSMTIFIFGGFGGKTEYGVSLMINFRLLKQVLGQSHQPEKIERSQRFSLLMTRPGTIRKSQADQDLQADPDISTSERVHKPRLLPLVSSIGFNSAFNVAEDVYFHFYGDDDVSMTYVSSLSMRP